MTELNKKQTGKNDSTQLAFNLLAVMPEDVFTEVSTRCDVNSILRLRQVSRQTQLMVEKEYPAERFDEDGFSMDHAEIMARAKRCHEIEDQLPGLRASITLIGKICHKLLPPMTINAFEQQRKLRVERRVQFAALMIGALAIGFAINFAAPVTAAAFSLGMVAFGFGYIKRVAIIVAKKLYKFCLNQSSKHQDTLNAIHDLQVELEQKKRPFIQAIKDKQHALREQIDLGRQLVDEPEFEGRRPGFKMS